MDPACAYAYTLSGHETIDEDPDKAITFFQSALRADPRHYNAWYVIRWLFVCDREFDMTTHHLIGHRCV